MPLKAFIVSRATVTSMPAWLSCMSAAVWSSSWFTPAGAIWETKLIVPLEGSPMRRALAEMPSSSVSVRPTVLAPSAPPRAIVVPKVEPYK
jgi:hypothetical protein